VVNQTQTEMTEMDRINLIQIYLGESESNMILGG